MVPVTKSSETRDDGTYEENLYLALQQCPKLPKYGYSHIDT